MNFNRLIILVSLLLLSGCAGKQQLIPQINWQQQQSRIKNIEQWTVTGRIGVKTPEQGFTANLNWQHREDKQKLRIYGSFGQTHAQIIQSESEATLEIPDEKIYRSDDIESLIIDVLGYPLPIEHLKYWILGLPYPDDNSGLIFDEQGYLKTINYQQWKISYSKYRTFPNMDNLHLPGKMLITDNRVTLKLSLRVWQQGNSL